MSRSIRCCALALLVLFLAAPLLAAGRPEPPERNLDRLLGSVWQRLVSIAAALGPEADPTGAPAPPERNGLEVPPPPADAGHEMDPNG